MRILFATTTPFFPDHCSGQNSTLQELATRLAAMGHEPTILAGAGPSQHRTRIVADRQQGFRLFRAAHPVKHLQALCLTLQPDVAVVADGHYEGLIGELQPLAIPLAAWFFQVEPHFFLNGAPDPSLLYLGTSRFLVQRLSSLFGLRVEWLPPYIEADSYRGSRAGGRVLFVNPVRQKGVEIAFALAEGRPDTIFTFVESWGLSEQWRRHCFERAARCGNVEWLFKTADMTGVFDRTRLLLVPRFTEEGFCRLVTEAQLGGIPALVSDRGNLPENTAAGGTVVGLDAGTPVWRKQLDRYLDDRDFYARASEAARAHADREEIQGAPVAQRLIELLQAHISRHGIRRFKRGT